MATTKPTVTEITKQQALDLLARAAKEDWLIYEGYYASIQYSPQRQEFYWSGWSDYLDDESEMYWSFEQNKWTHFTLKGNLLSLWDDHSWEVAHSDNTLATGEFTVSLWAKPQKLL